MTGCSRCSRRRQAGALVITADKCSNGPHLYYPNPGGPGGTDPDHVSRPFKKVHGLPMSELAAEMLATTLGLEFDPDGTRLFYMVADESWRPFQVRVHVLGTPVEQDTVLYQEDDVAQWTGIVRGAEIGRAHV